MNKFIVVITIASLLYACAQAPNKAVNSPLATVVKLQCAEELGDLSEARKYQDIPMIYGELAQKEGKNAEEHWQDYVNFGLALSKDKKFSNRIKYFNYDIEENITGNNGKVFFRAKDPHANIKEIVYRLALIKDSWIVQKIEYKN